MLDGQRSSDMEPDATAGLLQHAGSGPEDDDDGLVSTTVADGPAAERHTAITATPAGSSGSATVAGSQLNASGTEISLDGVRTVGQTIGSTAMTGSGKSGGAGATSTVSLKTAWKLKYQDFLPDKKGAGANNFNPISSEHFQSVSIVLHLVGHNLNNFVTATSLILYSAENMERKLNSCNIFMELSN